MNRLAWLTASLLALTPVPASAQGKGNALTPKEIADGWLLLFDGETTFGWKIEGEVKAADGLLVIGGDKPASITATTGFVDYDLSYEILQKVPGSFHLGWLCQGRKMLHKMSFSGTSSLFGGKVRGSDKNQITKQANDWVLSAVSHFALSTDAGTMLALRNVKLRPVGLKSIFNGKDLSGWREFPNKKSKFTISDRGELNVKNGPGDLQTEGQWGDFVLQLECFSNGKHLNSGVFLRCRPGEYQNGYEAQIRNQFTATPTQTYTADDYDPQTHKKTGSHKVLSTAVDYGTGAIYRRQPARKEVSRDGEWFTMTVVASGNHFATWVNGYQEVDWTDHRPASDNARTGFRRAAGPLSLQGHDVTTDLNFRNLRVAELPPGKK
jgi:hypothetical protein